MTKFISLDPKGVDKFNLAIFSDKKQKLLFLSFLPLPISALSPTLRHTSAFILRKCRLMVTLITGAPTV